jgi:hypothetical protein
MDVQGRLVATLADGPYSAGQHEVTWNARRGENPAPAGLYFVAVQSAAGRVVRRLVLTN